jgi:hypothetical protein
MNKYLGAGYYETFPWMNYDCKKGIVWDLTRNTTTCPCSFEVVCCHHPSKTTFSPLISKAKGCTHPPQFVSQNK